MTRRRLHLFGAAIFLAVLLAGCAARQMSGNFDDRADEIAAKLAEAERLGARDCSPRELAHARVELERVRHEALETHYPREWVRMDFDKVESAADMLLDGWRHAASLGFRFRCARNGG